MAINFPSSPVLNQEYSIGTRTWKWNGDAWELKNNQGIMGYSGYSGYSGQNGTIGVDGVSGYSGFSGYSGSVGANAKINYIKATANYTAVTGDFILADTSSSSFSVTLPTSPSVGDYITIMDGSNFSINNLTIDRNGSTIEGISDNILIDIYGIKVELIYDGTTWEMLTTGGTPGQARGGPGDQVFFENGTSVNADYSITNGMNAMSAGPITIMGTATVSIPTGSTWTIV